MIEEGEATWNSNFSNIEYLMLGSFGVNENNESKTKKSKQKTKVWWCPDYNRDGCDKKSPHRHI